jgi:serine/alanine adding enzyme
VKTAPSGLRDAASAAGPDRVVIAEAIEADREAWNEFVAKSAGAELYHDYRWRRLIETVFHNECRYLIARDGAQVRGVLPLVRLNSRMFGDFFVSVPYLNYAGILADSPAVGRALLDAAASRARELGVGHIELRHRAEPQLDLPAREDKVAMLLELPDSQEALWRGFDSKLRSQIRRPEKAGATTRSGGAELLGDFYAVFARNMRDLGTPVYSPRFFEAIVAAFPSEARVHVVDLAGRPVAAGITLAHRSTVQIPWASSLREANKASVNMLLYWSVIREAIARGFRSFDFGRSSNDSGTYRFKQQWGAHPQQLRWYYWLADGEAVPHLNPTNPKYRIAIAVWQRLPVALANVLGPTIARHLP